MQIDIPGVHAFCSNIWQTATTIVDLPGAVFVFDPTYFPSELAAIHEKAERLAGAGKQRYLTYTHSDWDHIVGASLFEGWATIAHAGVAGKTPEQRDRILDEIRSFDGQWYVQREPTPCYPRIGRSISEPTDVTIAGTRVFFLPTPGHTDDGLATFFPDLGLCVAGDLLSDLEFPFIYHSAAAYRRTLDAMRQAVAAHHITCLIPGHGPAATSLEQILRRIDNDADYLDRLTEAVAYHASEGLRGDALQKHLADFTYRGKPINPHIAKFHRDNVAVMERELANG